MLLTLYYMAATWVQAWRLSSIRSKISELLANGAGLVLYREPDLAALPQHAKTTDAWSHHLQGVSSSFCDNKHEARVADLLWYSDSKRGCSILPQQRIDVSHWIAGSSTFPFKSAPHGPSGSLGLSEAGHLHLLIEAEYKEGIQADGEQLHHCEVAQFGMPYAWLAADIFGLIVETDAEHLAKLCSCFMVNRLSLHHCLEMTRIQRSSSCADFFQGLNSGAWEAATGAGDVSPKTTFIELIKILSRAANEAAEDNDEIPVTAEGSTVAVAGRAEVSSFSLPENAPLVQTSLLSDVPSRSLNHVEEPSIQTLSVGGQSSDSFCSLDSFAATSLSRPGLSPGRSPARSALSTISAAYSTLSLASVTSISASKPPNVLIYSDSAVVQDNVGAVLRNTLHRHKYTIYSMSRQSLLSSPWIHSTRLLVVCGTVPDALAPLFLSYLLSGGRVLCLCSDFLHLVLPTFRTAEVRQHELVRFSYSRWKNVPMMHHVFCYQASPVHTRFPTGSSSASPRNNAGCGKPPTTPATVEVLDSDNQLHTLRVEVLGAEETWQTPSLLLATTGDDSNAGKIVFSQVHLEIDPSQYESEEGKYATLRQSDCARREILRDLLSSHLDMECGDSADPKSPCYTPSYFLGRHELKQEMLASLQTRLKGSTLKVGNLELQFCGKGESPPAASERLLPVLMHACPPCFSTVEYFDNLRSERLGRLVIHAEVLGSSMQVLGSEALWHGLAVIPLAQTGGKGRSSNTWISPPGCAMNSLQLIVPINSQLGQHASLIQHITATSVVSALNLQPDLASAIDLRLKWPNDIYIMTDNGLVKIGGLIVTCTSQARNLICNIGLGVNLDNRDPTTCINEQIMLYNARSGRKVPTLSLERFLALHFTEMERLINLMQNGHSEAVMDLYYKFWLHSDADIIVRDMSGKDRAVTVQGVDEFGFLLVQEANGNVFSVQPDGNSFDMCIGLVAPK